MTRPQGFTLIELAIVLVIVTILIGGLAVPLSAQIQARRIAETNKTLEEAREAIIGYAMTHNTGGATPRPYLPCPDTDGDGRENRTGGTCDHSTGLFPWVDLGVASQDAWGNHLLYAVTPIFANSATGFSSTDPGILEVCSAAGCPTGIDVADKVPALVLSYGPNGWGARNISGSPLHDPISNNELENTNADEKFVSRPPYKPADGSAAERAKEFDDLVVWIPDGLLKSRVCPAGGCP
jgi:prepilin-type N-terminal cleavage/methylation domain-containing protein